MSVHAGPNIVENQLILSLDAANIKSYNVSGSTWVNTVNPDLNTTLINTPTFDTDGWFVFNGSNQFADTNIPGPTTFLPSSDFTMSAVVNIDTFPDIDNASGTVMGCFNFDGYGIFWDGSTTQLFLGCQMRARASNVIIERRRTIDLDEWYYVVMSYSASLNFMKLYLNGQLTDTTNAISGSYDVGVPPTIRIGVNNVSRGANSSRHFPGKIAHCMIHNVALSDSEVQQNFNAIRGRFDL